MYTLPVRIRHQKIHLLTLYQAGDPQLASGVTHSFIVEQNHTNTVLFSVDRSASCVSHEGTFWDRSIEGANYDLINTEASQLTLVIDLDTPINALVPDSELLSFFTLQQNAFHANLDVVALPSAAANVLIHVQIHLDGQVFIGKFRIDVASRLSIYDVAMDCGSEASQIAIDKREALAPTYSRYDIVDTLKREFYRELKADAELHQRDEDRKLMRSIFFIKKENTIFSLISPPNAHKEKELVSMLTERKRIDELATTHALIPNIKLAHLGAYDFEVEFQSPQTNDFKAEAQPFQQMIGDVQQLVINAFLHTTLTKLRQLHPHDLQFYLNVKLLVPNVLSQKRISRLIDGTYKALNQIIANLSNSYRLHGCEVSTISESDASFLGYKNRKRLNSNALPVKGRFLIIDSGKGTTDFSIIDRGRELQSLFRSGFIGAGNALSYAFIETVFAALVGDASLENRQRAIHAIALGTSTDLTEKVRFIECIEQFKKQYDLYKERTIYKPLSNLIGTELQTIWSTYQQDSNAVGLLKQLADALTNVLKQQESIKDEFGFIRSMTRRLTDRLKREVVNSGFYTPDMQVLLTGRAFLFHPFTEQVREQLPNALLAYEANQGIDLKKICLAGAFSRDIINSDANLVGKPFLHQFILAPDGQYIREIQAGNKVGKVRIPRIGPFQKLTDFWTETRPLREKATGIFGSVFVNEPTESTSSPALQAVNPLFTGEKLEGYQSGRDTIVISGLDYRPDSHWSTDGDVNVFFTGKTFLLRSSNQAVELDVQRDFFNQDQFVFETLFPYIDTLDYRAIPVDSIYSDQVQ